MSRVVLHVGLPKSGTSYLQRLMTANKEALASAGVLFPGDNWREQVAAVRDVRGLGGGTTAVEGAWERLVEKSMDWPGDVVISMEWLAPAGPRQIRRIVGSFGERDVEVVFTARDLARTLPAAWQEFMQNGQAWTWAEFLAGVTAEDSVSGEIGKAFWRQQDLPTLAENWRRCVDREHVHIVTVPAPGADRGLLWRRFAQVLAIDPAGFDTQVSNGNESLGVESAELMRRLNRLIAEAGVGKRTYTAAFKHRLSKQVLAARRSQESSLSVPEEMRPWVEAACRRQIEATKTLGLPVFGELEELLPHHSSAEGRDPASVGEDELLRIALDALVQVTPARRRR